MWNSPVPPIAWYHWSDDLLTSKIGVNLQATGLSVHKQLSSQLELISAHFAEPRRRSSPMSFRFWPGTTGAVRK